MGSWDTVYVCPCGFEGIEEQWKTTVVYAGSLEEPPEFTKYCPCCGKDWEFAEEQDVAED